MMRVCGWVAVALAAALAATLAWLGVGRAPETTAEARRAMDGWQRRGAWHTWEGVQAHSVFVADSLTGSSSPAEDAAKPVLVLLHGFPTSSFDWLRVWDALAARFRLLAPDFLGFGFSDKPRPHNYSIFEQADLVEWVLKVKGVEGDFSILAHDYGDTVAQELLARSEGCVVGTDRLRVEDLVPAANHSGLAPSEDAASERALHCRVRGVVLLNGGVLPREHRPRPMQHILAHPWVGPLARHLVTRKTFGRSFAEIFGPATQPDEAELDTFWAWIAFKDGHLVSDRLLGYMAERRRWEHRWVRALGDARAPILFLNGPADPVSGRHVADAIASQVAGVDVSVLPEHIGHYPQWEAPELVQRAALRFLGRFL